MRLRAEGGDGATRAAGSDGGGDEGGWSQRLARLVQEVELTAPLDRVWLASTGTFLSSYALARLLLPRLAPGQTQQQRGRARNGLHERRCVRSGCKAPQRSAAAHRG